MLRRLINTRGIRVLIAGFLIIGLSITDPFNRRALNNRLTIEVCIINEEIIAR